MGIALSTAWNASHQRNGIDIIQEIKKLGINELELSFNLTREIVKDIAIAVKKNQIKINSLHNYCPIPEGLPREAALPDCYSLASCNQQERAQAVRYTKRTIDTASEVGAQAVILHCGRVEVNDLTRELMLLYNSGQISSPQARSLKAQMQERRQEKINSHFPVILRSLSELSGYAGRLNVKIGIENRFYFREIPNFEEIGRILKHLKNTNVYYWHDTGHAQLWENLEFTKHQDYLAKYSGRLLGIHFHDIKGTQDHMAPLPRQGGVPPEAGGGTIDFARFKKYLRPDTLLTIEAHQPATAEEIISAKEYLEGLFLKEDK